MRRRFLSVSELAEACSPRDADGDLDRNRLKLWVRRLRHWSTLNVFPAETMRHAEAGRHRLYDMELVYLAAVLLRVAAAGISTEVIKSISEELQNDIQRRGLGKFWEKAKVHDAASGVNYCLLIWIAEEGAGILIEAAIWKAGGLRPLDVFDPADEPTMILSLSDIFGVLRIPRHGEAQEPASKAH